MKKAVIIGAGLSGLGCAHEVPSAKIYEAEDRPGGLIRSYELDGYAVDQGAHILHAKDQEWVDQLCANAGDVNTFAQCRVSNYRHGHWITYPVQNHLHDLPEGERIQALSDLVRAQMRYKDVAPSNYDEWCLYQYGRFLRDHFYNEYTRKYWRVPMDTLATDWLSGRLLPSQIDRIVAGAFREQPETQPAFARFCYPRAGGFESFFRRFYQEADIKCDMRLNSLDPESRLLEFDTGQQVQYDLLASSIPLPELVRITRNIPKEIANAAKPLRQLQLLCVYMLIHGKVEIPFHWFYIYDNDIDVARVMNRSAVCGINGDDKPVLLQAEVFRRSNELLDTENILRNTIDALSRILDAKPEDVYWVKTVHSPHAYVISDHARATAVEKIRKWYQGRNIYTIGLQGEWRFMWSDAAYASGRMAGREIQEHL